MKMPPHPPSDAVSKLAMLERTAFGEIFERAVQSEAAGEYRHWNALRRRPPPAGFSVIQWWGATKLVRNASCKEMPLRDVSGRPFRYGMPEILQQRLHHIDLIGAGMIGAPPPLTDPQTRDDYLTRSLFLESLASSQLEGAAATQRTAKAMLNGGHPPRTQGERMIANNYRMMEGLAGWRLEALTPALILEMHRTVTEGTLDDEDAAGRLRRPDERVTVQHPITGEVYHRPPLAEELDERLTRLCAFANESTTGERTLSAGFVHPVVRAILLHFWLAYDHPFVDGNGRTARALFYWSMLRQRYELFRFLSISEVLLRAPAQYGMAFLHAETDDNDATYFLLHQTEVISRAIATLHEYVRRRGEELRAARSLFRPDEGLTSRQFALLAHALRSPGAAYTVEGHQRNHRTVYETARRDLLGLVQRGWLAKKKLGHKFIFTPTTALTERARDASLPP